VIEGILEVLAELLIEGLFHFLGNVFGWIGAGLLRTCTWGRVDLDDEDWSAKLVGGAVATVIFCTVLYRYLSDTAPITFP
jgi:hypothetical protein